MVVLERFELNVKLPTIRWFLVKLPSVRSKVASVWSFRLSLTRETVRLCYGKLIERCQVHGLSLVFTFAFDGSEAEEFVLQEGPANGSAELLASVVRVRGSSAALASGILFVRVQIGVTEVPEDRTVVEVRARLRDHVNGSAFRPAIYGRKTLCADHKFLDGFQGKLHHGPANGVVLVIHPIDGDVDVAATVSVDGKNGIAVFCGVVRVSGLHPGSQVSEVRNVTSDHRQLLDFFGRNVLAHVCFR